MSQHLKMPASQRRYALCIGIGKYLRINNHDLRYAVADAHAVAEKLHDPQRGQFEINLLVEPEQTTKSEIEKAIYFALNGSHLESNDLVVIYLSCHGNVYGRNNNFYLLPSDAELEDNQEPQKFSVIDIYDLVKMLAGAKVKNIIFLLDACYSGGASGVFQHLNLHRDLTPDTNLFMIGAARHDQVTSQSSSFKHGIFTHCLLQAFEKKPRSTDGWLSFSDIHTSIARDIESIKLEEVLQFQSIAATINPNIAFVKNPRYSPRSVDFAKNVEKLLELVQYHRVPTETHALIQIPTNFYIAEVKSGLRTSKVGIIPYYNEVEPLSSEQVEHIISFIQSQVEKGRLDYGILVVMQEIDITVKREVKNRSLDILTYIDIWKNLIDFKKYLNKLVYDYENSLPVKDSQSLAELYIPLNAEYRSYDAENHVDNFMLSLPDIHNKSRGIIKDIEREIRKGYEIIWQGGLQMAVRSWLANPNSSRLALLADYGSGKTSFCSHLAATLAKEYLEKADDERITHRFPLLIPLMDFAKVPIDLESYLIAYLKRRCGVDNPDFDALMKMAEAGYLFFMLDGFDEMASRANEDTIRQNIALFEELANLPKNKVMLTTRPEYFTTVGHERATLRLYPCLHLQLYNKEQIETYLRKRIPFITSQESTQPKDWEYYGKQIDNIHDLTDLARRPVLLEMISKTLPALIDKNKAINRPNLYQSYLEGEIERQLVSKQRRDLHIKSQIRFEIMEQIAVELYRTNKIELTSERIREISGYMLTEEQQEELDGSLREIVTCSFLIRKNNSRYGFSHQSFLDYFVARRLVKEINRAKLFYPARTFETGLKRINNIYEYQSKSERYLEVFRIKPISRPILSFLLELERGFIRKSSMGATWEDAMGYDHTNLVNWLVQYPQDKWATANTVSLLARILAHDNFCQLPLAKTDLNSIDLSGLDLHGVDLCGADLSDADLSYTNLNGALLDNANLTDANLTNANLSDAKLNDAMLRGANLSGAKLDNAELNNANLRNADLRDASVENTKMIYVDLRYADTRGTNFEKTNLAGSRINNIDLEKS